MLVWDTQGGSLAPEDTGTDSKDNRMNTLNPADIADLAAEIAKEAVMQGWHPDLPNGEGVALIAAIAARSALDPDSPVLAAVPQEAERFLTRATQLRRIIEGAA